MMRIALMFLCSAVVLPPGLVAAGRVANTSLQLPPAPPSFGFALTQAFAGLTFAVPMVLTSPPGETNRLFVAERRGLIQVITNLAVPNKTLFLDISAQVNLGGEGGLLGLAFHPGYTTNGWFFAYYTRRTNGPAGIVFNDHLGRFSVSPDDPNQGVADSEVTLISQADEASNHNGGDLHFGPDGYLYLSLGDEGGGGDAYQNSRRIDRDFFAGILRLDVDQRPGSLPPNPHPAVGTGYAIPPDNPFVGATSFNGAVVDPAEVRTEFWAVGLRNPWRMSFDPLTGWLYCGDVGQEAREEIDIIAKGGDYGWRYREGLAAYPNGGNPPAGLTFVDPIWEYLHSGPATNRGYSVTGGVVYRGTRLAELYGHYVFADYGSGNVWVFHYDGTNVTNFRRITTTAANSVIEFGVDPANGDVLVAGIGGSVTRLVHRATSTGPGLPSTLGETGAFVDLLSLTPEAGILPYEVNVPFWSDHALKRRWFSIPDTNQVVTFNPEGPWLTPTGGVWIKHFELELTNGVAESRRRLETRFLVRNASGSYGITYRWDDAQTNATLVPEEGLDESLVITDGLTTRTQVWHYPARTECVVCHTLVGGHVLSFNTFQLNREGVLGGLATNQLLALGGLGYFVNPPATVVGLPAFVAVTNPLASLEHRARSYLAANCVQCHQPAGPARGHWDARFSTPLSEAGIVDGPLVNDLSDPANRVLAPKSLEHSMILQRVSRLGPGQMPPLATSVLNTEAMALLAEWITNGVVAPPAVPVLAWTDPAPVVYGTLLGSVQLNATVDAPGSFVYTPAAGTVLPAGLDHLLSVHFTPDDVGRYTAVTGSVRLDVLQARLTITAEDKAMVEGGPLPELTALYAGFVNGETAANLSAPPVLTTAATSASLPGAYAITVSGAGSANYAIAYVDGVLIVEPRPSFQSVTFTVSGRLEVKVSGAVNRAYRLESSPDLLIWGEERVVSADAGGVATISIDPSVHPMRFFRLQKQ